MAPGRPCCGRAGDVQACITRHHSSCLLLPTGQQSPREKHPSHPVLCAVTCQAILKKPLPKHPSEETCPGCSLGACFSESFSSSEGEAFPDLKPGPGLQHAWDSLFPGLFFSCPVAKCLPGARAAVHVPCAFLCHTNTTELPQTQCCWSCYHMQIPAETPQTLQSCLLPASSSFCAPLEMNELSPLDFGTCRARAVLLQGAPRGTSRWHTHEQPSQPTAALSSPLSPGPP